ncbi:beta-lactamase family protein [Luteimonas sp. SJ-92]|uniref:Beta-lactamase family protein n=1 Tax=Luteimonas salinisoli TaxID=2752307 RepID=A0A853JHR7_9GAMM|nr:serine hydrolase domain-containing protein [Luteimonas salinisoli]NZA28262.1 beta-lactamase family protein [Luteimonas salinisoli]
MRRPCLSTAPSRAIRGVLGALLAFTVAGPVPPLHAGASEASAQVAAEAARLLEQHVEDVSGPGIAVLVARGDQVLFRDARGMASVELGVPLQAGHVVRIASITKQFSAAGLLRLVDQGKVKLDDPLSAYLPEFPGGHRITLAQLLNHTSGVRSYTRIPSHMDESIHREIDTASLVAVFGDHPVDFGPGQGYAYNDSGYVLVGAVIEKVTGQAWDDWLKSELFERFGLERTRGGATRSVVPGHAAGYRIEDDGTVSPARPLDMTQPHAAGALLSTVDDLWRWNRALHGGRVLSAESYRRMVAPEGPAADAGHRYGFGIRASTLEGLPMYEHSGGILGFVSMLLYLPEGEITVAVVRNATGRGDGSVDLIARRLATAALGAPDPASPAPIAPGPGHAINPTRETR